jgi:hypothetical protein
MGILSMTSNWTKAADPKASTGDQRLFFSSVNVRATR